MTVVDIGLGLVLALAGVTVIAALVVGDQRRSAVAGTLSATLGLTAAVTGLAALAGTTGTLALGIGLPGQPALLLAPDRLGGLFLAIVGCVSALAAWFGVGYARGASATRVSWTAYPVFVLGMVLVPASADALGFLLGWELMAISSTVLLAADHATGPRVRSAVLWYAAMTHLSFVLLLAGFAVLATHSGSLSFIAMAAAPPTGATAAVAFVLLVGGFATKAGLVPVHVWLPRAHPEAPSHVSAVMSAAMVKMGVYGLLLLVTRLLPEGPAWWGIGLLALGAPSALYGILQASVTSDLKRLLAYSTTENVGLIVTAIAVAMLLGGDEQRAVADVALVAALLLTVSHSAFKTVLFLSAGAIVHGTGERDLDRLGGLSRTMPVTSAALGVGGLAAAALPISSGFVAEWVLLQSLVHGNTRGPDADRLVAVALPVTVSIVALTAGLALLTFVKVVGIAALARPRSIGAAQAHEGSRAMTLALGAAALAVLSLGLLPGVVAAAAASAVGAEGVASVGLGGVALPAVNALLDPTSLAVLGGVCTLSVLLVTARFRSRHPRRTVPLPWGCGGSRVDPRMQYTATSFAEPLVRVFDNALRPATDVHVTPAEESRYLVQAIAYRQQVVDRIETRGYQPLLAALDAFADKARALQNGSMVRYLGYSFAALVVVLLVVTW